MSELGPRYEHKEVEKRIYRLWEKSGYFAPEAHQPRAGNPESKKTFCIMMAPPNVTGSLHMGHALENTMIDVLIRWKRMQGYKTLWLPGIDHASISTHNVIEKELKKEGLTRFDLGRERFLEKAWEWKKQYGGIILDQLKKLGASCDWSRTRFTMDEKYIDAVLTAFVHYYKKGLIYRGLRTITWCPRCGTGISDLEVKYKEEDAILYYIQYGPFTLATVRPETKFGDTALAVNPEDVRYKKYIGKEIEIESLDVSGQPDKPSKTKIKVAVVADDAVDPEFGTGVIKVTPAHDITDFEIAQRHKLPMLQVIDEHGRMNENAGKYGGMKTKDARDKVASDLRAVGLLLKEEPYRHNTATCERCGTVVEPLPSLQWFVKMDSLAELAKKTVRSGRTKILPANFEKNYFSWLDNIRDWCISRQLWWGHQLPVFFCKKEGGEQRVAGQAKADQKFVVAKEKPKKCPICGNCEMEQSPDVLDTWFSSALWPFATLGWPEKTDDLKKYYPTDFITSAREILNLWIMRMIFSGEEFMDKEPFAVALIHGTILTKEGRRMSKSLGTGIDPLSLIENHGADATRFGVVWQAMGSQDIRWDETSVQAGRKFNTKLWNIARFLQKKTGGKSYTTERLEGFLNGETIKGVFPEANDDDLKILEGLRATRSQVVQYLENYEFGQALHTLYDFVWHNLADKYVEQVKTREDELAREILHGVFMSCLTMLHPFMPFITEEIYQQLKPGELLMVRKW